MGGRKGEAAGAKMLLDLQRAARIGGNEQVGPDLEQILDFAGADLVGAFGLDQVVDARTPAALLAVGNLHQFDSRNPAKQPPRLGPDALSVCQMAGIVVSGASFDGMAERGRRKAGEKLIHV